LKKKFKYNNFLAKHLFLIIKQIFTILKHPDPYQNVKDPEHWGEGAHWFVGEGAGMSKFGRGDRHS
jgi:hypothetical protein